MADLGAFAKDKGRCSDPHHKFCAQNRFFVPVETVLDQTNGLFDLIFFIKETHLYQCGAIGSDANQHTLDGLFEIEALLGRFANLVYKGELVGAFGQRIKVRVFQHDGRLCR